MAERPVRLSVLDRLVAEPMLAEELSAPAHDDALLYRASVGRNIEWLLNTRRVIEPAPAAFPEVQRSVFHFGLPDFNTAASDTDSSRRQLARSVTEAIEIFEPRLADVRVTLRPTPVGSAREVRFLIEGTMRVDRGEERIELDTVLNPTSGRFSISGARDA